MSINSNDAKTIINYVTGRTKPRWQNYIVSYNDLDDVFLSRAYEQQGLQFFKFESILKQNGIFSISQLGSILDTYTGDIKYRHNPSIKKGLESGFYKDLLVGKYGNIGMLFYKSVEKFYTDKGAGRFFWMYMWYLLNSTHYLKTYYKSSFKFYVNKKYAEYKGLREFDTNLLYSIKSEVEWNAFKKKSKPWEGLMGVGENVFDFIFGDVHELDFAKDSFKWDSSNEYFIKVTGISKLINGELGKDNVIKLYRSLGLNYHIREINKGIYTYCSETENSNFGYCRNPQKCGECEVVSHCEKGKGS